MVFPLKNNLDDSFNSRGSFSVKGAAALSSTSASTSTGTGTGGGGGVWKRTLSFGNLFRRRPSDEEDNDTGGAGRGHGVAQQAQQQPKGEHLAPQPDRQGQGRQRAQRRSSLPEEPEECHLPSTSNGNGRPQRKQRRHSLPTYSSNESSAADLYDDASFTGMMIIASSSNSHKNKKGGTATNLDKSTPDTQSCSSDNEDECNDENYQDYDDDDECCSATSSHASEVSEVTMMTYSAEITTMIKDEFRKRLLEVCQARGTKLSLEEGKELLKKIQDEAGLIERLQREMRVKDEHRMNTMQQNEKLEEQEEEEELEQPKPSEDEDEQSTLLQQHEEMLHLQAQEEELTEEQLMERLLDECENKTQSENSGMFEEHLLELNSLDSFKLHGKSSIMSDKKLLKKLHQHHRRMKSGDIEFTPLNDEKVWSMMIDAQVTHQKIVTPQQDDEQGIMRPGTSIHQQANNVEQSRVDKGHNGTPIRWSPHLQRKQPPDNNIMLTQAHNVLKKAESVLEQVQSFSSVGTAKMQNTHHTGRQKQNSNFDWAQAEYYDNESTTIGSDKYKERARRWNHFLKTSTQSGGNDLAQVQSFCSIDSSRTSTTSCQMPSRSPDEQPPPPRVADFGRRNVNNNAMAQVQSFSTMRGMKTRRSTQDNNDDWDSMRQNFDLARSPSNTDQGQQYRPNVSMPRQASWNRFSRRGSQNNTMARAQSFTSAPQANVGWFPMKNNEKLHASYNDAVLGMNGQNQSSINFSKFLHTLPESSRAHQHGEREQANLKECMSQSVQEEQCVAKEGESEANNSSMQYTALADTFGQSDNKPKSQLDEIIELKLQIANQQATIDTLSSKLHNVELANRKLLAKNDQEHESLMKTLQLENEKLVVQLQVCAERECRLRNELENDNNLQQQQRQQDKEESDSKFEQQIQALERRNQELMDENSELIRQLQDRNCLAVPPSILSVHAKCAP